MRAEDRDVSMVKSFAAKLQMIKTIDLVLNAANLVDKKCITQLAYTCM